MPRPYRLIYSGAFDLACLGLYGRFMEVLDAALEKKLRYTPLDDTTMGVASCTAYDGDDLYTLTITNPDGRVTVTKGKRNKRTSTTIDADRLFNNKEVVEA